MFETPLEGLTVVATQYSLSYCLVMFASETPGGKHYPNRLLVSNFCSFCFVLFGTTITTWVMQSSSVMQNAFSPRLHLMDCLSLLDMVNMVLLRLLAFF